MAWKFGSVDSEVGMQTSISGSISHVTEVKGEYQQHLNHIQEEEGLD